MILAGHSHRNLVFEVTDRHKGYPLTLSEGEVIRTDFMDSSHLVRVKSSSGPLPKYLKKIGTAIYNANQAEAGAQSFGAFKPEFNKPEIDEFKGMVLIFKMEPDFDKRKNMYVCGY
jgi:hypothetical protein